MIGTAIDGSALHVTGTNSAFIADLYDCLRDLTLPGAALLGFALDPPGWSAVVDTVAICPDLRAVLVGSWPPAAAFAFARAEPASLPVRAGTVDAVLLGAAAFAPQRAHAVFAEARRVLRSGGGALIASPSCRRLEGGRTLVQAVAWCRALEEHGFSVEKTLATRAAPPHEAVTARTCTEQPASAAAVCGSSISRDSALAGYEWESLIVQARRW